MKASVEWFLGVLAFHVVYSDGEAECLRAARRADNNEGNFDLWLLS